MRGLNLRRICACIWVCLLVFLSIAHEVEAQDWQQEKSIHFIIHYSSETERSWARTVLRKAEYYYDKVASAVGYTRYQHFWTWDLRVPIYIYPDQKRFMEQTGQPSWSRAGAWGHRKIRHARRIVTFKQESGFLDGVLPHEISHLILRDFIGLESDIPKWFDEGVAQLYDSQKLNEARRIIRGLVRQNRHIPLALLEKIDIRRETDPVRVAIFYAQSVTMVDYMIKKYGSRRFGQFCRVLKNGRSFQEALGSAYSTQVFSLAQLEEKWLRYMNDH